MRFNAKCDPYAKFVAIGDYFQIVPYPTRGEKTNMRERRVVLDTKGGVMAEWPEHLRVRQFPSVEKLVTA